MVSRCFSQATGKKTSSTIPAIVCNDLTEVRMLIPSIGIVITTPHSSKKSYQIAKYTSDQEFLGGGKTKNTDVSQHVAERIAKLHRKQTSLLQKVSGNRKALVGDIYRFHLNGTYWD